MLDPDLACISLGDLQFKKKNPCFSFKVLEKVNLFLSRNEKYCVLLEVTCEPKTVLPRRPRHISPPGAVGRSTQKPLPRMAAQLRGQTSRFTWQ